MHETPSRGRARRRRSPIFLALCGSLWLGIVGNWVLFRALLGLDELRSWRGAGFVLGVALMLVGVHLALLALAAWPRTIKPALGVLLLAAALGTHFMARYGVVIDPTMMVNALQTDAHEVADLVDASLAIDLVLLAVLPLWLLWRTPLQRLPVSAQALRNAAALVGGLWLAGGLGVVVFADLSSTMRNHKSLRYMVNPLNSVYALGRLAGERGRHPAAPPAPIGDDARLVQRAPGGKPPLLLLVVGETARADHFSHNGYARPTNAHTAGLGMVSFAQVTSCGTSTAASLPCMFSHLGRAAANRGEHQNLLDLLQQAGLAVLWLDNQSGCKGVCDRVPHAFAQQPPPGAAHAAGVCDGSGCFDAALLTGLDQRLDALPRERRERGVVLVLHMMGSHGPAYFKRSPRSAKVFGPECTSSALQDCDRRSLVNAYDHSIAYTDRVLADAVRWLDAQRDYAPLLLYVSDHGESLGENNLYLHGMPHAIAPREQTHVPMLLWLPAAAAAQRECLRERRQVPLSHDNLFHSVLGLVNVGSSVYRSGLDIVERCRSAAVALTPAP